MAKYAAAALCLCAAFSAGCASAVGSESCMAWLGGCSADASVDAQGDGSVTSPDAGNNNEVTGNDTGDTTNPNPDSVVDPDVASGDAPKIEEVCKGFLELEGTEWTCDTGEFFDCTITLVLLESGDCGARCPGTWKVPAHTLKFNSDKSEMVYDTGSGAGPHTCIKKDAPSK